MKTPILWWIRRDPRLADNPTLLAALNTGLPVLPVFILDPALNTPRNKRRLAYLLESINSLDSSLRDHNMRVLIRVGKPADVLGRVLLETGAKHIFAETDLNPYATQRDDKIGQILPLTLIDRPESVPLRLVKKEDGSPYQKYTPFARKWRSLEIQAPLPAPAGFPPISLPKCDPIPFIENTTDLIAGEFEARKRLAAFASRAVYRYAEDRNHLDLQPTSRISADLRFGSLSHRSAVWAANSAIELVWSHGQSPSSGLFDAGPQAWLDELIWRDFFTTQNSALPGAHTQSSTNIYWRNAPEDLQAWKDGQTGVPIIDAAMRQLKATGWMPNRARMITASFLIKDLLIDWREGEKWFADQLLDADAAVNKGNWMWVAGVGAGSSPFFRVMNPILQAQKFDPEGGYIRQWIPVLGMLAAPFLHDPWLMSDQDRGDYPAPIVDHAFARQRALKAYNQARTKKSMY